jgi:tryptophanyl-tRNA synthetase
MSKSDPNEKSRIDMLDPENIIKKRIKSAMTDSIGTIKYEPIERPGISNLLTIYSVITNMSFVDIEKKYIGKGYKEFKEDLGEIVYQELKPIQERYYELIDSKELDEILDNGRDRANQVASKKVYKLMERIGLGRKRQ